MGVTVVMLLFGQHILKLLEETNPYVLFPSIRTLLICLFLKNSRWSTYFLSWLT